MTKTGMSVESATTAVSKKKNQNKKKLYIFIFVICLVVVGALTVYYQVMKRQQMQKTLQTPTTEKEKLIAKDLEQGYPETPTEVMKLWGRMNQCLYNTTLEDDEFNKLVSQLRVMYSTDLIKQNPESGHKEKIYNEISSFKDAKKKIINYSAENGTAVAYKTINNRECAYLKLSYYIKVDRSYSKVYQDFILVKENEKWKILGFKAAKSSEVTKEEATS